MDVEVIVDGLEGTKGIEEVDCIEGTCKRYRNSRGCGSSGGYRRSR